MMGFSFAKWALAGRSSVGMLQFLQGAPPMLTTDL
jgi:hypothetical protein